MEHDSGTDHQEEAAADGKENSMVEEPAVDSSCSDNNTTSSPSAATENPTVEDPACSDITSSSPCAAIESKHQEKEDSDTKMIDDDAQ